MKELQYHQINSISGGYVDPILEVLYMDTKEYQESYRKKLITIASTVGAVAGIIGVTAGFAVGYQHLSKSNYSAISTKEVSNEKFN
jgi:hypothetical protein